MPAGFNKKHQGPSWILRPPSEWNTWEEYLQLKPGEFTPDQIVAEVAWKRLKIDRTVTRILMMFDWYSTSRLVAVIGCFEQ